jgi:hypothetical protein
MARKPAALARELLRNFPKSRRGKTRRRRKPGGANGNQAAASAVRRGAAKAAELQAGPTDGAGPDERDVAGPSPDVRDEALDLAHEDEDQDAASLHRDADGDIEESAADALADAAPTRRPPGAEEAA